MPGVLHPFEDMVGEACVLRVSFYGIDEYVSVESHPAVAAQKRN